MAQVKNQEITEKWAVYNADCIEAIKKIKDSSVGLSIFSPPFFDLYSYSDDPKDLSNCSDYESFLEHFGFLVTDLYRVLMPGRVVCVHCMDLPTYKRNGDEIGLRDFPGAIVRLFESKDFIYHSRHAIWKDPLTAATRTKAIGLAHKQIVKDSSLCRTGILDYLLAFRKPGENPQPVAHPKGFFDYCGSNPVPLDVLINPDPRKNKRSQWIWQQYASPVWDDIRQTKVLSFREGKDPDDMRHICPLQTDVIERCLILWSNPGDVVLTPFAGVGSEVYGAVKLGRRGIGFELKGSYYRQMIENLKALEAEMHEKNQTLFDGEEAIHPLFASKE